jgi:hypothetical protein
MVEDAMQQGEEAGGARPRASPMAMCPMAKTCKGMINKPPSGLLAMLAGAVLIAVGMLIIVEPRMLVWIVGAAFVLFGIMLLIMATFIRRLGVQLRDI